MSVYRDLGVSAVNHDGRMRAVALFWPYNDAQRRHLLRVVEEYFSRSARK